MNNRVIFLLVRLNNGITRLLAGFSASVGAFGAVMKTIFFFVLFCFFHRRPKNISPVDFQTAGEQSQTKEGASESFAL